MEKKPVSVPIILVERHGSTVKRRRLIRRRAKRSEPVTQ